MKKIIATVATIVCVLSAGAGFYAVNADAYSYEDARVERVANYNGGLTSKVQLNNGYAMICEPVASGLVEVGVKDVKYSADGSFVTVTLYDKNGDAEKSGLESNYVAYWNIYVPTNDNTARVIVEWN